jgi:hypothetical protein
VAAVARALKPVTIVVVAGALLFALYWRQSLSQPISSDGASNVLQAWAMLHGNLLLHGWQLSDVSFYTTELPQYMLIEAVRGLSAGVVNIAAAMTYTLLVILVGLLAKGDARGRDGLARCLLASGIMLAPQLAATSTLLQAPDHTGTAVPLLLAWLLIDRARPRWYVPVAVWVILAWTMAADSIVLVTGIAPLVVAAIVRSCRDVARGGRPRWYELALAGAALAAGLGAVVPLVIRNAGGYQMSPVQERIATIHQLPRLTGVAFQAALKLFGADVFGAKPGIEAAFVALHLVGAVLAVWALGIAVKRFFTAGELLIPAFAVGIVLNIGAFILTAQSLAATRETAAVLPLGAVLAGRLLAERVLGTRLVPVLGVAAAGYLAALAYGAAQTALPPMNQSLATWLVAHRLSDGLGGYWQANSTTLDSGTRITVSSVSVSGGKVIPSSWETSEQQYESSLHYANFVVVQDGQTDPTALRQAAQATFGHPQQVYRWGRYTVLAWHANLLTALDHPARADATAAGLPSRAQGRPRLSARTTRSGSPLLTCRLPRPGAR